MTITCYVLGRGGSMEYLIWYFVHLPIRIKNYKENKLIAPKLKITVEDKILEMISQTNLLTGGKQLITLHVYHAITYYRILK